jgi:aldose 1-epimerase
MTEPVHKDMESFCFMRHLRGRGGKEIMEAIKEEFGRIAEQPVYKFKVKNENGVEFSCLNYGCIITEIMVPDRNGNIENVVLGYDTLDEYLTDSYFLGAVIGRVAGRIKSGSFELDGKPYSLTKNENGNHLHGGVNGFHRVVWDSEFLESEHEAGVRFTYSSPDGEEGYPGNLCAAVTYILNNKNELIIRYDGSADQKTLLNMTNHTYFNLSGDLKRDIRRHTLKISSDRYLPLNEELLPSGELSAVQSTPFDLNIPQLIEKGISSKHPQMILAGGGYDHPFLLSSRQEQEIILADHQSGRTLTIETDEPGVVVYSGNQLKEEGEIYGVPCRKYLGICLETQGLPDAINHPQFPSVVLEKGEEYHTSTVCRFGTAAEAN